MCRRMINMINMNKTAKSMKSGTVEKGDQNPSFAFIITLIITLLCFAIPVCAKSYRYNE